MTRRGLFLDLDGTLADSLPAMYAAYERLLAEHGRRATREEFQRLNGIPLREVLAELERAHGLGLDPATAAQRYLAEVGRAYAAVQPTAGAHELVDAAREAGWRLGLVTSGPAANARAWLERTGFAPFDAVVGGDTVEHGKPDPAPYRAACELAGCDAARSLAIEDSRAGARSAVAAGLATWVLAHAATEDNARSSAPARADWPAVAGFVHALDELVPEIRRVPLDADRD